MELEKPVEKVGNVEFTEAEKTRWEQFTKSRDAGLDDEEIAQLWGLKGTKQVERLKKKAKQNGHYTEWINAKIGWLSEEFPKLHKKVAKKNLELAYKTIAFLYARTIPEKIESANLNVNKSEVNVNVTSDLLKQYESLFEEATLLENCAPQPLHPPQTNP
jgi:hypothetical protein